MTTDLFTTTDNSHLYNLTLPNFNDPIEQVFVVFGLIFLLLAIIANRHPLLNLFSRHGALLSYSKFTTKKSCYFISSRVGMTFIYLPAFLLGFIIMSDSQTTASAGPRVYLTSVLVTCHFGKRTLECLFLHKYSSTMPLTSSLCISSFYTLLAYATIHCAHASSLVHDPSTPTTTTTTTTTLTDDVFEQHAEKIISQMLLGLFLFGVVRRFFLDIIVFLFNINMPFDTFFFSNIVYFFVL